MKLASPGSTRRSAGLEVELLGEEGLCTRTGPCAGPSASTSPAASPGYRYLRAKGNSIEGGTTEVLLNIVAERVLGLPAEPRNDKDVAWKDLPR